MYPAEFTVLDPAADRRGRQAVPVARKSAGASASAAAARVVLLSNSKPNVDHLLEGLRQGLWDLSITDIRMLDKGSPTIPMPPDMFEDVVNCCDLFVTAMAD
jgi:hypothetical protein